MRYDELILNNVYHVIPRPSHPLWPGRGLLVSKADPKEPGLFATLTFWQPTDTYQPVLVKPEESHFIPVPDWLTKQYQDANVWAGCYLRIYLEVPPPADSPKAKAKSISAFLPVSLVAFCATVPNAFKYAYRDKFFPTRSKLRGWATGRVFERREDGQLHGRVWRKEECNMSLRVSQRGIYTKGVRSKKKKRSDKC